MKTTHWLFLVSIALFVSGVIFIVAAARDERLTSAVSPTLPEIASVATVRQIMTAMIEPASTVVFDAVSTTVEADRIEEKAPRTDDEWEHVGANAAVLAESANLLVMPPRLADRDAWLQQARALRAGAEGAMKAVESRDAAWLFEAGGAIYEACDECHRLYKRGS